MAYVTIQIDECPACKKQHCIAVAYPPQRTIYYAFLCPESNQQIAVGLEPRARNIFQSVPAGCIEASEFKN